MFAHITLLLIKAAICHGFAEFQMFPGFGARTAVTTVEPKDSSTEEMTQTITITTTEMPIFDCPEEEKPVNIGSFEVPSQRDLVLLVRRTLTKKFQSYNNKALFLLRDIKEASKAATLYAEKCFDMKYMICVNKVKHHCSDITKKLMTTVEEHRGNITFFTQGHVCNMAAMTTDPLMLLKMLAAEEVTLNFALPAFLRLLSECRAYCRNNVEISTAKKPTRRLSDQAFLVKHILSNNIKPPYS